MTKPGKTGKRVYQDIARVLSKGINSEEYPDGSLLPSERELAEMFDASRTSVREALLLLQASGIVRTRPRARAIVTKLNNNAFFDQLSSTARVLLAQPDGVANFQEARVLFECGLARYATKYASPKELEKLSLALAKNKKAMNDPDLFAKTDVDFHSVIAGIAKNPIFTALNASLAEWLMEQRTTPIKANIPGSIQSAYKAHEKIYEAIASRDPEAADQAMASHLEAVSAYYWKALEKKKK